jgi:hypothetical protein
MRVSRRGRGRRFQSGWCRPDILQARRLAGQAHILAALDALAALSGSLEFLGSNGEQRFAFGDHLAGPVAQRTVRLDDVLGLDMADLPCGFVLTGVFEMKSLISSCVGIGTRAWTAARI